MLSWHRQCFLFTLFCALGFLSCGVKPGGPEDPLHLLTGRWFFEPVPSEIFNPRLLLIAQTEEDSRFFLDGELFGTHFERITLSPPAPEAFLFNLSFTRLEQAGQYEQLTLSLDGRLTSADMIEGIFELRANLSSGGSLRIEYGVFSAVREPPSSSTKTWFKI